MGWKLSFVTANAADTSFPRQSKRPNSSASPTGTGGGGRKSGCHQELYWCSRARALSARACALSHPASPPGTAFTAGRTRKWFKLSPTPVPPPLHPFREAEDCVSLPSDCSGKMLNLPSQSFPAPDSQQRVALAGRSKVRGWVAAWGSPYLVGLLCLTSHERLGGGWVLGGFAEQRLLEMT